MKVRRGCRLLASGSPVGRAGAGSATVAAAIDLELGQRPAAIDRRLAKPHEAGLDAAILEAEGDDRLGQLLEQVDMTVLGHRLGQELKSR